MQDNGSAGASPARLPQTTFDYARVMETAMKPVSEFADSFSKTMEVERARMIKAESDDAERQVIGILNDAMMGENGYLTQQGKNAVDGYEKSMEGIRTNVDQVIGNLSPQAREAIESRLNDRVLSTVTQANRHRMAQSQQWQLGSSKARIDSLNDDYAMHFGDPEYQKKTMASIMSEIDYVANLQGMDAEQKKALKFQTYSLAQAKMYAMWAQKDPVAAFAAYEMSEDKLDPDVAIKIENQLFAGSRDLIALSLASDVKESKDGKVEMAWFDDPLAKTGNAFIDSLPDDQRFQITTRAKQLFGTQRTELRNQLKIDVENSLTEVRETGQAERYTADQFVSAYGPKDGAKLFTEYSANFDMNKSIFDMRGMSDSSIADLLKHAKPKSGDSDFAMKQKRYEVLQKAASQIMKARKDDPVGYMMQNGIGGYSALKFDNASALDEQLRLRANTVRDFAKTYGADPALFSKGEAEMLVKHLDGTDANGKAALLTTIYDAVGEKAVPLIINQLKSGKTSYAIAMGAMGMRDSSGISAGSKYLIGKEAIANKMVLIDTSAELGETARIRQMFETQYDSDPDDTVAGVYPMGASIDASVDLALGVYAYNSLSGIRNVEGAVEQSVGEIHTRNKKKLILPQGMDDGDFEDKVTSISRSFTSNVYVGNQAYSPDQIPNLFSVAQLQTYERTEGGIRYAVSIGGMPMVGSDGKQVYIEVK